MESNRPLISNVHPLFPLKRSLRDSLCQRLPHLQTHAPLESSEKYSPKTSKAKSSTQTPQPLNKTLQHSPLNFPHILRENEVNVRSIADVSVVTGIARNGYQKG